MGPGLISFVILHIRDSGQWDSICRMRMTSSSVDKAVTGFVRYSLMVPELRGQLLEAASRGFGSYRDVVLFRYFNDADNFPGSSCLYLRKHPQMLRRWLIHHQSLPKGPLFL